MTIVSRHVQSSPVMLWTAPTLTQVLVPPAPPNKKQATGGMQGTSKPLQYSPEALEGRGPGTATENKGLKTIAFQVH